MSNLRAIKNPRAHADQAEVSNHATVHNRAMSDGDAVANDERPFVERDVAHGQVLNVGLLADTNVVHIAADDGVEPDAALIADFNIADDGGIRGDEDAGGKFGKNIFVRMYHDSEAQIAL